MYMKKVYINLFLSVRIYGNNILVLSYFPGVLMLIQTIQIIVGGFM